MPVKTITPTPSAYNYPLLIKNLLLSPLNLFPKRNIVYRDLVRYDYVTFAQRLARFANVLKKLGVQQGDTIAVMDFDSHRYLECFFAIPMFGAILHTINIRLSPEQILYTINHAKDDVILINAEFLPVVERFKDQITTVKKFILLTDTPEIPESTLNFAGEYENLLSTVSDHYDFPDFDENAQATTFYTTGTTGDPKGVYFSHRQLVLHTFSVLTALNGMKSQTFLNSESVYMPLTPMFHVHAWGFPYICTLLGVKQVYPGKYEPKIILELLEKEKVTFSHCVPTVLHLVLNHPSIHQIDLSHWQIIVGGSMLATALCQQAMTLGINVYTGYGMSETCPVLTLATLKPFMLDWQPDQQAVFRRKTGLPIPLAQIRVINIEDGKELPHDGKSLGEVVVRSPWTTQGYLENSESSEKLWQGGWLHTGDIGHIDAEGYLQVTDRLKDMIKVGGEWLSSSELEDVILQHEAVLETAVIGVPNEKWGESPTVFIVLRADFKGKISERDILHFLKNITHEGKMARYVILTEVVFVEAIPKTSVGKIDKKQLRKQM